MGEEEESTEKGLKFRESPSAGCLVHFHATQDPPYGTPLMFGLVSSLHSIFMTFHSDLFLALAFAPVSYSGQIQKSLQRARSSDPGIGECPTISQLSLGLPKMTGSSL